MYIYDSTKKAKLQFIPLIEGEVTLYVCGPTVYDDAHLGHAKSALVFDLLTRVLKANNYKVTYARNITDIDDKIIYKAIQEKKPIKKITDFYTSSFHNDMAKLGVKRPDIEPKATENLDAMIELIQKLIDKGHAYETGKGDVYFDTASDKRYLTLSNRIQNDDDKQERVESSTLKKNQADFALWKKINEDSISYESLAKDGNRCAVDIHGGGADLLFPHHENEAAQTRCATNF